MFRLFEKIFLEVLRMRATINEKKSGLSATFVRDYTISFDFESRKSNVKAMVKVITNCCKKIDDFRVKCSQRPKIRQPLAV